MATIAALNVRVSVNATSAIATLKKLDTAVKRSDRTIGGLGGRFVSVGDEADRTSKDLGGLGKETDKTTKKMRRIRREGDSVTTAMTKAASSFRAIGGSLRLLAIPTVLSTLGSAVAGVSSLTAGAVALAGALKPLSGLAFGAAGGLSAMAQGMLVGKLAANGLSDAFKLVFSEDPDDFKKFGTSFNKAGPAAKRFIIQLTKLRPTVKNIQKEVQALIFDQLDDGLRAVTPMWGVLEKGVRLTAGAMGEVGQNLMEMVGSLSFLGKLDRVLGSNSRVIGTLGSAAEHLAEGFMSILAASGPLVERLAGLIEKGAGVFRVWAQVNDENGRLASFMVSTMRTTRQVGRILWDVVMALSGLMDAAQPAGDSLLDSFEASAQKARDFVESARGIQSIRDWTADALPVLREMGNLAGAIATELGTLGGKGMGSLVPILQQLRTEFVPSLGDALANANVLAPSMIDLASAFVELFAAITGDQSAIILLLNNLTALASATTSLVRAVPYGEQFFAMLVTAKVAKGSANLFLGASGLKSLGREAVKLGGKTKFIQGAAAKFGALDAATGKVNFKKMGWGALKSGAASAGKGLKSAAVGAKALAMAGWAGMVKGLKSAAVGLKTAAIAAKGFAASMLANPVFLIIAGIVALGAALFLLYKKWKPFRKLVDGTWQVIQRLWDQFLEGARIIGRVLVGAFGKLKSFLSPVFDIFEKLFKGDIIGALGAMVTAMPKMMLKVGVLILKGIVAGLTKGLPWLLGFIVGMNIKFIGWLKEVVPKLASAGWDMLKGLGRGIAGGFLAVAEWFVNLPGKIWELVTGIGGWLLDKGKGLMGGMLQGIKDGAIAVWDWIKAMPRALWDLYSNVGEWLLETGGKLLAGLLQGIKDKRDSLWQWFKDLPGTLLSIIEGMWDKLKELGASILNGLIKGITDGIGKIGEVIGDIKDKFVEGLGDAFSFGSPSKLMMGYGELIGKGLENGVRNSVPGVVAAMDRLTSAAVSPLSGTYGEIGVKSPGIGAHGMTTVPDGSTPAGAQPLVGSMTVVAPDPRLAGTEVVRKLRTQAHLQGR